MQGARPATGTAGKRKGHGRKKEVEMETISRTIDTDHIRPPVTSVGVIGWIRANLFNSVFKAILTSVTLFLLGKALPPLVRWAFIDSVGVWQRSGLQTGAGACRSIVSSNFRFILFGFYPQELQWRPLVAMLILFGLLFYSRDRNTLAKTPGVCLDYRPDYRWGFS